MDCNDRIPLLDAHPRHALPLDDFQLEPDGRLRLRGRAGELGIALARMHITQAEQRSGMVDGQEDAITSRHVADVEIAAPVALTVNAGRDFAIGADTERANEGGDWPRNRFAEVQSPIDGRAARTGGVLEYFGGVFAGAVGVARRIAQRTAAGTDRDP